MAEDQSIDRGGETAKEWRERPWVLAAMLGLAGLCVHFASDGYDIASWRAALTAALVFGPLAAAFTLLL